MKRKHYIVDGQLVKVYQKWSELRPRQKNWIMEKTRKSFQRIADYEKRPITRIEKSNLIHTIYNSIIQKGIWIPYGEIFRVLSKKISRWNGSRIEAYGQTHPPNSFLHLSQ